MPVPLLAWLAAVNLAAAGAYAWDKQASRRPGARRMRERTLFVLCLAGGAGGAWLVFLGMRHKTLYRSFWLVQGAVTVLWLAVLAWLILA